jgi:hypothetical protein
MPKLSKNLKLNWPESLGEITLKNMNSTELWFLREQLDGGNYKRKNIGLEVRDPKFGYNECYIDIDDTRYLVKHKQWAWPKPVPALLSGKPSDEYSNVVFFVQKFKKKLGDDNG